MVNEQTISTASGMPPQAAVSNPPVVAEQSEADRARAALGGTPLDGVPEIDDQSEPEPQPRQHVRGKNRPPPARFKPPTDLEFEFTHPERVELRNSNLPLTLGLLGSILGAFVVFFVSLS